MELSCAFVPSLYYFCLSCFFVVRILLRFAHAMLHSYLDCFFLWPLFPCHDCSLLVADGYFPLDCSNSDSSGMGPSHPLGNPLTFPVSPWSRAAILYCCFFNSNSENVIFLGSFPRIPYAPFFFCFLQVSSMNVLLNTFQLTWQLPPFSRNLVVVSIILKEASHVLLSIWLLWEPFWLLSKSERCS